MGCGCGRNKGMRGATRNPLIAPRQQSVQAQNSVKPKIQAQNNKVQAQSKSSTDSKAKNAPPTINKQSFDSERRAVEKKRREAILKRLGRI